VGVSVTNALSTRLEVTVWRDGNVSTLAFSGGDVIVKLTTRKAERGDEARRAALRDAARQHLQIVWTRRHRDGN